MTATPEGTESLAVRWVPFDEVLAMTLDGRITDAMTVLAVHRAAIARLGGRSGRSGGRTTRTRR